MSLLFFLSNRSEHQLSTTPQACIIIPDLLLLHTVGEEGEGGTARRGEGERKSEETKMLKWRRRGERHPVTKQLLCQKARRTQNTRSSTHPQRVNKGGGGGWWKLKRQNDVTEDDRSILTALTVRTARALQ